MGRKQGHTLASGPARVETDELAGEAATTMSEIRESSGFEAREQVIEPSLPLRVRPR